MSNRTATTLSPFPRPSAALPYPKHERRQTSAAMRSPCIYTIILCFQGFGQEILFVPAKVCNSRNLNSRSNNSVSSAGFGGRLQRPSLCNIRSAHRRERGRMPIETSEKLQKYRVLRRNSGDLVVFYVCSAWIIYKNWQHFQCPFLFFILERYKFFFVVTDCETE